VDDALGVGVGDGLGDRQDVGEEGEAGREGGGVGDHAVERAAGHELHRVERGAGRPATGGVHGDDAGVLQAGGQQDLADEPLLVDLVAGDQQLLEGDGAVEDRVVGL
jgi:hypothetical protein